MGDHRDLAELILYAEPGGALGARCAELWASLSVSERSTTAQEYPPHVTLTGFFRRRPERLADVVRAFHDALDAAVPAGLDGSRRAGPVTLAVQVDHDWAGLRVESAWMEAVTAAFAERPEVVPDADEDAVRTKPWLHVSLAYGDGFDALDDVDALVAPFAATTSETEWSVALWERAASGWIRHAAVELVAAHPPADGPRDT